ncbi:MAG TPA: aminoglycoside phosphotransferase family protein [Trueperaceae bacterium]
MPADTPPGVAPALPDALAAFTRERLGRFRVIRFAGWRHAETLVWELAAESGERAFLKSHRQARKFRQELRAYREWLPHLPALTPVLLGAREEAPFALLLSALPGRLVEDKALAPDEERELSRQAGAFLRYLHDLPFLDTDPVTPAEALRMRLAAWLPRARGLLTAAELDWVSCRVQEAIPLVAGLRRVPDHRDYTPRNWLVGRGKTALRVIDFEHARPDLRVLDFEKLWTGPWLERPDLGEAFWHGYGRPLTGDEEALLERYAAFGSLTTIVWAREHHDEAFEERGRQNLARLHERS